MELDILKLHTTWNDAANSINTNFSKIQMAIASLGTGGGGLNEDELRAFLVVYLAQNGYATKDDIDNAISDIINGAPSTLDTLKEIADALAESDEIIVALNNAIGTKASKDELNEGLKTLANSKITISGVDVSLGGEITQQELRTGLGLETLVDWYNRIGVAFGKKSDGTYFVDGDFLANGQFAAAMVGAEGGGSVGVAYLADLYDVSLGSLLSGDILSWNGSEWVNIKQSSIVPDLSAYATKNFVTSQGYIKDSVLVPYLKESVADGRYATIASLNGVDGRLASVEKYFATSEDADSQINKWNEIVTFLNATEGTTLAGILATYATKDALAAVADSKITISGLTVGLGGSITQAALRTGLGLDDLLAWYDSVGVNFQKHSDGTFYVNGNLVTKGQFAASLVGQEGGGGGVMLLTSWPSASGDYSGYALGGNLGIDLNTRVKTLEDKATAVSFSPSLTSGKQIGVLTIDGVAKSIYAPSMYDWSEINAKPTKLSDFTDDVVAGNYLSLSGGVIESSLAAPLEINSTSQSEVGVAYCMSGTYKGWIGYNQTYGAILYNYPSNAYLGIRDNGKAYLDNNELLHSGNYSAYALPLTGGTMVQGAGIYSHLDSEYGAIGFNNDHIAFGSPNVPTIIRSSVDPTYWNGSASYTFIHSGNIGSQSVASAAKLATPRTIWGQSFDGTGNIDGDFKYGYIDIQYTDEINRYGGNLYLQHRGGVGATGSGTGGTTTGNIVMCANGGNVGIGALPPAYKLDVNGTLRATAANFGGDVGINIGMTYADNTSGAYDLIERKLSGHSLYFQYNHNGHLFMCQGGGNVIIGATSDSGYRLDVAGTLRVTDTLTAQNGITTNEITIGGVRLYVEDGALKINGNVFATGQFAAGA